MARELKPYVDSLRRHLEPHADPEYAKKMEAYLRNQFRFLGMKTRERNQLFKEFLSEHGLPDFSQLQAAVDLLFGMEHREFHYFGVELAVRFRKEWTAETVEVFETMATTNSWWDSVDYVKSACLKDYFRRFPEGRYGITDRWIRSGNIWLQRLSVIFQLGYKRETDTRLLAKNIKRLLDSDEFFVQKAIGWALRDYARTDPDFVRAFVKDNELKPLSRREAMKHLK